MTGRRKNNLDLPRGVHLRSGGYYYFKSVFLGRTVEEAVGKLEAEGVFLSKAEVSEFQSGTRPKGVTVKSSPNHPTLFFYSKWISLGRTHGDMAAEWTRIAGKDVSKKGVQTWGDVFDRYQVEELPKKSPSTVKDQARQLNLLRRVFGHLYIPELTSQAVFLFRDAFAQKSPVSANRHKSLLSHICTFAMSPRLGIISTNPCRGVPRVTEIRRSKLLSLDEMRAFYEASPPMLKYTIRIAYMTGMDLGMIIRLPPIPQSMKVYTYQREKTKKNPMPKKINLAITTDLRKVFDEAMTSPGHIASTTHMIRTRTGRGYTLTGMESLIQRAKKKAGLNGVIMFRDIRALAATVKKHTHGMEGAQDLLAHFSPNTTARYVRAIDGVQVTPNADMDMVGPSVPRKEAHS